MSENEPKEVCTIRIMFPVTSDEQAIDYKKKISSLLSEIKEANMSFTLMKVPPNVGRPSIP